MFSSIIPLFTMSDLDFSPCSNDDCPYRYSDLGEECVFNNRSRGEVVVLCEDCIFENTDVSTCNICERKMVGNAVNIQSSSAGLIKICGDCFDEDEFLNIMFQDDSEKIDEIYDNEDLYSVSKMIKFVETMTSKKKVNEALQTYYNNYQARMEEKKKKREEKEKAYQLKIENRKRHITNVLQKFIDITAEEAERFAKKMRCEESMDLKDPTNPYEFLDWVNSLD